jgi:hypothetical protein
MRISMDLPNELVQVVDTENYKGVPVTVLRIMGEEALFYHGRGTGKDGVALTNQDWEGIFKRRIADFLGDMLMQRPAIACDWQEDNPTGRELCDPEPINFVREEF